jgi:cytochrome c oxidase subunit 2
MPVADQSQAIDHVWNVMLWTCTALYVAVLLALAWAIWRRKEREGISRDYRIFPALLGWVVLVVGFLTWFVTVSFIEDRRLQQGKADLDVRITAKQWWWQVEYLGADPSVHFTTANELHLPRDRTARVELRSGDVIHSFWVPPLSGKKDLIPGRTNALWITPRRDGIYRGQCAEFCGLQHAHMALDVAVADADAFAAWRAMQMAPARAPSGASALAGSQVFERAACATCHTIRGTPAGGRVGPDLTHVASRLSLAAGALPMQKKYLIAWIEDPQHFKPGNRMPAVQLSGQEMAALADYLLELQ